MPLFAVHFKVVTNEKGEASGAVLAIFKIRLHQGKRSKRKGSTDENEQLLQPLAVALNKLQGEDRLT
jgi:hypothetical protein